MAIKAPSCEACKIAHKPRRWDTPELRAKKLKGFNCAECQPALHIDNKHAFDIYSVCNDQLIVAGMGQAVGVILSSIYDAIDHHPDLEHLTRQERWALAADVQLMGRTIISLRNKKAEKTQPAAGSGRRGKGNS